MIKTLFFLCDKFELLSFWGGVVSSFACTIIYESISELRALDSISSLSYAFNWISSILMTFCCVLLLSLSSKMKKLYENYSLLLSLATNAEKEEPQKILILALEKQLKTSKIIHYSKNINYYRYTIVLNCMFYIATFLFIASFVFLIFSQVVN